MTKNVEGYTVTDYNESGDVFFDNNEYDKAIDEYNKATELNPKDALSYKNRGVVFWRLGEIDKAVVEYTKAIELNDKFSDAYRCLGRMLNENQQYDEALFYLAKAIESEPDNSKNYNARGTIYFSKQKYDKAMVDFTKAIKLEPDSSCHYNRGATYYLQKEYDKAIDDFTKTIKFGNHQAEAYSKRGTCYFNKSQYDKAMADYTKAIELNPNHIESYDFRAKIYEIIGKQEKAQKDRHRIERINESTLDTKPKNIEELTEELNTLIGLDKVKKEISQLINFLKVQQMREVKGMTIQPLSRHLVFYGNPGTGKTTVARLLSQIYKSLGILSEGHLVETDRAGLVAGYVGQTALKVREVVSEAIGGVLFIDEAYALSTGGDNDFGREAIDTLIKMMEDNRDDLIVVVAGYTDKMSAFLQTNPGLRSRFNKYLEFEDYTPEKLVEIFELFCTNGGYKLSSSTHDDLIRLFSVLYETRDETFGNGRLARNLYEMTINNQANRIVMLPNVDDEILSTIEETDIPGMADLQSVR